MDPSQICCFTGHRFLSRNISSKIQQSLKILLPRLIEQGIEEFRIGGALGFDTLAAQEVIAQRKRHPHITLTLMLPHPEQQKRWRHSDQVLYNKIRAQADLCIYVSPKYYDGCLLARNRRMVDGCGHCICYCTRDMGGSAYTMRYAEKKGVAVYNLADTVAESISKQ